MLVSYKRSIPWTPGRDVPDLGIDGVDDVGGAEWSCGFDRSTVP